MSAEELGSSISSFFEYDLTFLLLIICIVLFGYLALRSRNVRSFQFQVAIFILIWIAGELANVLLENGLITVAPSLNEIGYEIHVCSMVLLAILLYARYYLSRKRGTRLIEPIPEAE